MSNKTCLKQPFEAYIGNIEISVAVPAKADSLEDHPILNRFHQNSLGYWHDYRWYIYLFVLAGFLDALSTIYFMTRLGVHAEFHPVVRTISHYFGPVMGPLLGALLKSIACLTVTVYLRKLAKVIFLTASSLYIWAAWYNIWGITFDFKHCLSKIF